MAQEVFSKDIERKMNYLVKRLDEMGIAHSNVSESKTDYGHSAYLHSTDERLNVLQKYNPIFGLKFRISDHSTERARMMNEVHFDSEKQIDFFLNRISQYIK